MLSDVRMASMEIKQQLRLSQQLVMTPQLQQAIKLLQLSRMELVELVRQEMTENPVLEEGQEGASDSSEANAKPTTAEDAGEKGANGADAPPPEPEEVERKAEAEKGTSLDQRKADEIDWDRYLENHALQQPPPSFRPDNDELPSIEATLTKRPDLTEHLMWQSN